MITELDRLAAARLPLSADPDDVMTTAERQRLLETIIATPRPATAGPIRPAIPPRRLALAGLLTAVVAAAVVIPSVSFDSRQPPASAQAVALLNIAASNVGFADTPLKPGQYRAIQTHAWNTIAIDSHNSYLVESLTNVWQPFAASQTWERTQRSTGRIVWLAGDQAVAERNGTLNRTPFPTVTQYAKCGGVFSSDASGPCPLGDWLSPTLAFMASLPRNPDQLRQLLTTNATQSGISGPAGELFFANTLLATGLTPADLRAALYHALTHARGLTVLPNVTTLDGAHGTAITATDPHDGKRYEMILDPHNGQFIGDRTVETRPVSGRPADTIDTSTSVTTRVVAHLGSTP